MMWKAIHIAYYDDEHDRLLLDGIKPVISQLQHDGSILRAYSFRIWNPAPTMVVHIETEHEASFQKAFEFFKLKVGNYLRAFPSKRILSKQEQRVLANRWGTAAEDCSEIHQNNSITLSKLTLPHGLHEDHVLFEMLHSFYAYTYEIIIHEVDRCRENSLTRCYRLIRMMALYGGYDLQNSLLSGYTSPRRRVESYLQSLREREFVKKQFEDANDQYGLTIDSALYDLHAHMNIDGQYEGDDKLLRLWSSARYELFRAISTLVEKGLIPKKDSQLGLFCAQSTAYQIMNTSMQALMPLFQLDLRQQHMMEYLLIRSLERMDSVLEQRKYFHVPRYNVVSALV
ncbi:hypothetical protein [Paenibacillus marinisediminis]